MLEFLCGGGAQLLVGQQGDQGLDVVATVHIAQQFNCLERVDQRACRFALGDGGQKPRFNVGGLVHAGGHPVADQVQQVFGLSGGRALEQLYQRGDLLGAEGLRGNILAGAFGHMFAICFKHG